MAHAIETERGETEDGKNLYTPEEHERLGEHKEQLSDDQFDDWSRAKVEGRVVSGDAGGADEDADLSSMSADQKAKRLGRGR